MLKVFFRRMIARLEHRFGVELGYVYFILDHAPKALRRLARLEAFLNYREGVPLEAWHAARIVTAITADCGACAQITVVIAEEDGISADIISALVEKRFEALPPKARLGAEFAQATLDRSAEGFALRNEIVERWGEKALISLAIAVAGANLIPTIKYGLGQAQSCSRITVRGKVVGVNRAAA